MVWENFMEERFSYSTPNIRLLKDKLLAKVFTTAFHKLKLNDCFFYTYELVQIFITFNKDDASLFKQLA